MADTVCADWVAVPQWSVQQYLVEWLSDPAIFDGLMAELDMVCDGEWTSSVCRTPTSTSIRASPPVSRTSPHLPSGKRSDRRRSRPSPTNSSLLAAAAVAMSDSNEDLSEVGGAQSPSSTSNSASFERAAFSPASFTKQHASSQDRLLEAGKAIPRFFFPVKDIVDEESRLSEVDQRVLREIRAVFPSSSHALPLKVDDLELISRVCGFSLYLADNLYASVERYLADKAEKSDERDLVTTNAFVDFWTHTCRRFPDMASRVLFLLRDGEADSGSLYLEPQHFRRYVRYVLEHHPGLEFLLESPDFHERYIDTVTARIFYSNNRSWSGRLSLAELRRSDVVDVMLRLDDEHNINDELCYFSYEHFYVIYTSFWKLDTDHDLCIDLEELARYGDCGLSDLALQRIFSGAVFETKPEDNQVMSYWDFVYFILSEEDKTTPTSIEYWFRVMDIDGDGCLSMYELELFYEQQLDRLSQLGIEGLTFKDCLCVTLDMINPSNANYITLGDLRRCGQASVVLNTFLNVNKYLDQEEREQGPETAGDTLVQESMWDRFAQREYILLSAEEDEDDEQAESSNTGQGLDVAGASPALTEDVANFTEQEGYSFLL